MSDRETFELACSFTGGETDKAVQIYDYESREKYWIPLSQVEEMHRPDTHQGDGRIVITAWIAKEKGFYK